MADIDIIRREASRIHLKTRGNAKRRGIGVHLTVDDIRAMLIAQDMTCALSGIRFDTSPRTDGGRVRPFIPSLDRINSSQPYSRANTRIVCAAVNAALGDWGDDIFHLIALGVANKQGWTRRITKQRRPTGSAFRLSPSGNARYETNIRWRGKRWYLGVFPTAEEASAYYQHVKWRLHSGDPIHGYLPTSRAHP